MTDAVTMSLVDLPPEILNMVMGYIPYGTRLVLRLTCRYTKEVWDTLDNQRHKLFIGCVRCARYYIESPGRRRVVRFKSLREPETHGFGFILARITKIKVDLSKDDWHEAETALFHIIRYIESSGGAFRLEKITIEGVAYPQNRGLLTLLDVSELNVGCTVKLKIHRSAASGGYNLFTFRGNINKLSISFPHGYLFEDIMLFNLGERQSWTKITIQSRL